MAHVGLAHLSQDGSVAVLHHRMHDALGMHYDLDAVRPAWQRANAPRSLPGPCSAWWPNRPKSCVPCSSWDGHTPGPGHLVQVFQVMIPEGAARGREQQSPNAGSRRVGRTCPPAMRHALEDGVMFAVDRQQFCAVVAYCLHEERASGDQRLFVGQQHTLTRAGGGQRRRQARQHRRWQP